jgi:hypothetical protein
MEQPTHDLRAHSAVTAAQATPGRIIAAAAAILLQVGLIYALAAGLAAQLLEKLPEELKAEVVQEKIPDKTPSSGHDRLDQAAVQCAQAWHYKPAMQNGQPVEVPWQTAVQWKLR